MGYKYWGRGCEQGSTNCPVAKIAGFGGYVDIISITTVQKWLQFFGMHFGRKERVAVFK